MIDSNWADFWWNNITGANMVVSKVTESLLDTNLVILFVPDDLPWRYEMRTAIEYSFRKNASSENVLVQTIDAADDCGTQEPGNYLLDRFCTSRAIRTGYREGSSKTIQQYLISNKVLHDSIIWVKGFKPGQAEQWIKFCKGYKSAGVTDGLFLLEIKDQISSGDLKSLSVVRFDDWITNYDVQLLNSFILDRGQGYSINWKKYISTLAACLCESDAEVSAELLSSTDFSVDDPFVALKRIDESGSFSSRGRDLNSNHVLTLFRSGKNEELRKRIWTAQVRVLFPLIELERVEYIRKYESEIQAALDSEEIRQYGEIVSNPTEVEIGTLDFLVKSYRISMPLSADRQRIDSLRHYRNTIAHMGCLPPNEVSDLLNYS
jgi:hypothetical protein